MPLVDKDQSLDGPYSQSRGSFVLPQPSIPPLTVGTFASEEHDVLRGPGGERHSTYTNGRATQPRNGLYTDHRFMGPYYQSVYTSTIQEVSTVRENRQVERAIGFDTGVHNHHVPSSNLPQTMNSDEGNIPTSNFTEAGTIDENGRPERTILSNSLIGRNDALFNSRQTNSSYSQTATVRENTVNDESGHPRRSMFSSHGLDGHDGNVFNLLHTMALYHWSSTARGVSIKGENSYPESTQSSSSGLDDGYGTTFDTNQAGFDPFPNTFSPGSPMLGRGRLESSPNLNTYATAYNTSCRDFDPSFNTFDLQPPTVSPNPAPQPGLMHGTTPTTTHRLYVESYPILVRFVKNYLTRQHSRCVQARGAATNRVSNPGFPYQCRVGCGSRYDSINTRRRHEENRFPIALYLCLECLNVNDPHTKSFFLREDGLRNHAKRIHDFDSSSDEMDQFTDRCRIGNSGLTSRCRFCNHDIPFHGMLEHVLEHVLTQGLNMAFW